MLEWSRLPGLLPRVRFGPDRGKDWAEISDESLAGFLHDRDVDVRYTAEQEAARRGMAGPRRREDRQERLFD